MIRQRLIVFVKTPRAGRVKTRLGRDIGMVAAAWWYRHRVRDLLRRLSDPRWEIVLAIAPDTDAGNMGLWPGWRIRLAQGRGDLGQRMARAFDALPPGPACLIGTDVPGIQRHHIEDAFTALGRNEAVLGPATDGGYWLIGFKRNRPLPPALFKNVRWSGPHAMADTIATLGPLSHCTVATLKDVDYANDLMG